MSDTTRTGAFVLRTFIDALSWSATIARIDRWAQARESRYVCLTNVHAVVTAGDHPGLAAALDGADLALPDGMPVAWTLRRAGYVHQPRLSGPDLMWRYCEHAANHGRSIFLFGSTRPILDALVCNLMRAFPALQIAGSYAPPMRAEGELEPQEVLDLINRSGAGVVFVGLGCPKQELWMRAHRPRLHAVLLGVGAAFDYHAGAIARAPQWAQQLGVEWAFRLPAEPRRLYRRYLGTNTRFIFRSIVPRSSTSAWLT